LVNKKEVNFILFYFKTQRTKQKAGLIKIRKASKAINNQFIIPLQRGPVPSSIHHPSSRGGGFGRVSISTMSACPVEVTLVWQQRMFSKYSQFLLSVKMAASVISSHPSKLTLVNPAQFSASAITAASVM